MNDNFENLGNQIFLQLFTTELKFDSCMKCRTPEKINFFCLFGMKEIESSSQNKKFQRQIIKNSGFASNKGIHKPLRLSS